MENREGYTVPNEYQRQWEGDINPPVYRYDEVTPQQAPIQMPVQEEPKPAKEDPGLLKYKFKKPVEFEDKVYSELTFDFNSLTGMDVEIAISLIGPSSSMALEFDKKYHAALAARAAKVPHELLKYMGIADYTAITLSAQNFILGL